MIYALCSDRARAAHRYDVAYVELGLIDNQTEVLLLHPNSSAIVRRLRMFSGSTITNLCRLRGAEIPRNKLINKCPLPLESIE